MAKWLSVSVAQWTNGSVAQWLSAQLKAFEKGSSVKLHEGFGALPWPTRFEKRKNTIITVFARKLRRSLDIRSSTDQCGIATSRHQATGISPFRDGGRITQLEERMSTACYEHSIVIKYSKSMLNL